MSELIKKCIYQGQPAPVREWGGDCSVCKQDEYNFNCKTAIFASYGFFNVKAKSNGHDPELKEINVGYPLKRKKAVKL